MANVEIAVTAPAEDVFHGERKADEYFAEQGIPFPLNRIDCKGRIGLKS